MAVNTYKIFDPATLELVGEAPEHGIEDVRVAIERGQTAAYEWASDRSKRQHMMREIAEVVRNDAEKLGRILSREQGKILEDAKREFLAAAAAFDYYADLSWDETEQLASRGGREVKVQYRPVGLVGTITPWNFPISLLAVKVAPALAAGCTVIAKPSATTPLSTVAFVDLLNTVLPQGVVQTRTGSTRAVNVALSTLPQIRKISFTGSTQVGSAIAAQAAETVKRLTLELGGNDGALILEDADIEATAEGIAKSAFRNAGQVCMAVKRVYVPRQLQMQFAEAITSVASQFQLGHGLDDATTMGPMHSQPQLDFVRTLLAESVDDGAIMVSGGKPGCDLPGYFLEPTVVAGATSGMRLVDEEQFGNVLPIVAYDDLEDAIAQVNSGLYGLGASVWSQDLGRAEDMASKLHAGTVWVNQHSALELDAPFGGWKTSGIGREWGSWGLDEYLETRTVNIQT